MEIDIDKTLAIHGYITIQKTELRDLQYRVSTWGSKLKVLHEWGHILPEPYQDQFYNILTNGETEA